MMFELKRSSFFHIRTLLIGFASEQQEHLEKLIDAYIWCLLLCEICGFSWAFKQKNLSF